MNKQQYMDGAEQAFVHTYNRFPVVFERGEGVRLYDTDGKEYLDFAESYSDIASFIASFAFSTL